MNNTSLDLFSIGFVLAEEIIPNIYEKKIQEVESIAVFFTVFYNKVKCHDQSRDF